MRGAWALLIILTATASAGGWRSMLSPGPVHQGHDPFAGDCDSCHLVFDGIPDARCLDCHDGLAAKIQDQRGFHTTVVEQPCINCHTDHLGLEGETTKAEAREAFRHEQTGFDLHGAHEDLACAECHTGKIEEAAATCGDCHEDSHESARGPECEACHVATEWTSGLKTVEAHRLDMAGLHGQQSCEDCHTHGEHLDLDVPCSVCHDEAHGGTRAPCEQCHQVTGFAPAEFNHGPCTCGFPGKHQTVGCLGCHEGFVFTGAPTLCSGCHDEERPHDPIGECSQCHTATSWADNRFDHNRSTTFPIDGKHLEVSCAQCHTTSGQFAGLERDCASCHQELGDGTHGDFGACIECHDTSGFSPSTFDHATTGFALGGAHSVIVCQECHAEKVEGYPGR